MEEKRREGFTELDRATWRTNYDKDSDMFFIEEKKKKNTYLNGSQASVVVPYCQEIYP